MTSRDVIHSFFVPAFRVKQDVVPGRYTTMWFEAVAPGSYSVLCSQYCGTGHSTMRGEVVALEPAEFERWLHGEQKPEGGRIAGPVYVEPELGLPDVSPPEQTSLAQEGVRVAANHGCLRCHTLDGTPHLGPTWAGLSGARVPLDDGTEVVADVAYLTGVDDGPKRQDAQRLRAPSCPRTSASSGPARWRPWSSSSSPSRTPTPRRRPSRTGGTSPTRARRGDAVSDDHDREEPFAAAPPDEPPEPDYLHSHAGIRSWLLTTHHKRIALMFYVLILAALGLGGLFALILRTELLTPGPSSWARTPTTGCSRCTGSS